MNNSLSLFEFLDLMEQESAQPKKYNDAYAPYIARNWALYQELKKQLTIEKKLFNTLLKFPNLKLNVLAEPWCLDAVVLTPLIEAMLSMGSQIDFRFYLRDDHEALMNQYLTNGSKSIPIVFTGESMPPSRWGPRTKDAQEELERIAALPLIEKRDHLYDWYLQDRTKSIQLEWNEWFKSMPTA